MAFSLALLLIFSVDFTVSLPAPPWFIPHLLDIILTLFVVIESFSLVCLLIWTLQKSHRTPTWRMRYTSDALEWYLVSWLRPRWWWSRPFWMSGFGRFDWVGIGRLLTGSLLFFVNCFPGLWPGFEEENFCIPWKMCTNNTSILSHAQPFYKYDDYVCLMLL